MNAARILRSLRETGTLAQILDKGGVQNETPP
jgi:hypothetical protein